jgi:hypothetical protein
LDTEQFFLKTIEDLRHRIECGTEYDLIVAAALVRKLILDSPPLIHQINRRYGTKIRFPANSQRHLVGARTTSGSLDLFGRDAAVREGELSLTRMSPEMRSAREKELGILRKLRPLPLYGFLKSGVFTINGHIVSVRELTRHLAHSRGGVHLDPRKGEAEIARWDSAIFGDLETDLVARAFVPVARVVLRL